MKLQHKAGPDIIYELALYLYPSSLESFREGIANSLDEGTKKVQLEVSSDEVVVEDWGEGINDAEKFTEFGQYAKAKLGGETIGMKGLGKLSLLRLGKNVEYRTNNGEIGIKIVMTPEDFDIDYKSKDKFLSHQGTRVIIEKPKEVPQVEKLAKYLEKVFAVRIAQGTELILNGVPLNSRVDKAEYFLCRLKGGIDVNGNIKAEKKSHGSLDLYVKHVFVKSILIDPERDFGGWVNCNELIPVTNRNDLVENDCYLELVDHLKEYAAKHFPKRTEEIGKDEAQIGNELSKLLKSFLKDMKIFPQGSLPLAKGTIETDNAQPKKKGRKTKEQREEEEKEKEKIEEDLKKELHSNPKTENPVKRISKTDFGMNWVILNAGNEKEPLYFMEPNMVIQNRTNDLYKFALKKKASLGPKWLRLAPYLARVAVSINPESKKWTAEQLNLEADRATRYFLKRKHELTEL